MDLLTCSTCGAFSQTASDTRVLLNGLDSFSPNQFPLKFDAATLSPNLVSSRLLLGVLLFPTMMASLLLPAAATWSSHLLSLHASCLCQIVATPGHLGQYIII